jgi:hypothetical protein
VRIGTAITKSPDILGHTRIEVANIESVFNRFGFTLNSMSKSSGPRPTSSTTVLHKTVASAQAVAPMCASGIGHTALIVMDEAGGGKKEGGKAMRALLVLYCTWCELFIAC